MSEFVPSEFEKKRKQYEDLAGYSFDVDKYLGECQERAAGVGISFHEHVRQYFQSWDQPIKDITFYMLAAHVSLLPSWHQSLHEELQVQSMLAEGGVDVENDPSSQRDLALVFGYWYDCLAYHLSGSQEG